MIETILKSLKKSTTFFLDVLRMLMKVKENSAKKRVLRQKDSLLLPKISEGSGAVSTVGWRETESGLYYVRLLIILRNFYSFGVRKKSRKKV